MEPYDIDSEAGRTRLLQMHRQAQACGCISGVTHDVNNLLGAAMAYAELVSYDETISEESSRMLGQIVEGITRCSQLISSLTSISRKDRVDVNLVSPAQLMDEVLALRDYELKLNRITVERKYQGDLASIPVDIAKLKMALIFLLTNAQEALKDADVKTVKVTVGNADGGVCFDVWDAGAGLRAEDAEKAFELFQTAWTEGDHIGMGLFSARKIAELHGGELTYTSAGGFRLFVKRDSGLMTQL